MTCAQRNLANQADRPQILLLALEEKCHAARKRESAFNARAEARSSRNEKFLRMFDICLPALGDRTQRSLRRAKDFSTHGYLPC